MNLLILKGRVVKDSEFRTSTSGNNVAKFTVAVDREYSKEKKADFLPCVAFGKLAEFAQKYLLKGTPVLIRGRVEVDSYQKSDGTMAYTTTVKVDKVEFAGTKPGDDKVKYVVVDGGPDVECNRMGIVDEDEIIPF